MKPFTKPQYQLRQQFAANSEFTNSAHPNITVAAADKLGIDVDDVMLLTTNRRCIAEIVDIGGVCQRSVLTFALRALLFADDGDQTWLVIGVSAVAVSAAIEALESPTAVAAFVKVVVLSSFTKLTSPFTIPPVWMDELSYNATTATLECPLTTWSFSAAIAEHASVDQRLQLRCLDAFYTVAKAVIAARKTQRRLEAARMLEARGLPPVRSVTPDILDACSDRDVIAAVLAAHVYWPDAPPTTAMAYLTGQEPGHGFDAWWLLLLETRPNVASFTKLFDDDTAYEIDVDADGISIVDDTGITFTLSWELNHPDTDVS